MKNIKCEKCGKETHLQDGAMVGACGSCGHQIAIYSGSTDTSAPSTAAQVSPASEADRMLKRALLCLEDGEFEDADKFCERVLDMDPENPRAYIVKLCVELGVTNEAELANLTKRLSDMPNYKRALRFADVAYREQLEGYNRAVVEREKNKIITAAASLSSNKGCISAGCGQTVILMDNGMSIVLDIEDAGTLDDVTTWNDIAAVSLGLYAEGLGTNEDGFPIADLFAIGLKKDGSVVAAGNHDIGECAISRWHDMLAVSAGWNHILGLRADGSVAGVSYAEKGTSDVSGWVAVDDVSEWKDIKDVSAGGVHLVGLKTDGRVMVVGDNSVGQCDVSEWTDIIGITAGAAHTVGIKADGTVVATGRNDEGQCGVSDWNNIVQVSAGFYHTVGVKADGTVVAVGSEKWGLCDVSDWCGIVSVSAGLSHTVGITNDGSIHVTGEPVYEERGDSYAIDGYITRTYSMKQLEVLQGSQDELFQPAVELVVKSGRASISMIQRELRTNYARAGRLVEAMARRKIIAKGYGAESREVLITWDDLKLLFGYSENEYQKKADPHRQSQTNREDIQRQEQSERWRELGLCPKCGGTPSRLTRRCKVCGTSCR